MSVSECTGSVAETETASIAGAITGTLIGFADNGRTPLVTYPAQPGSAALLAQSVIDLCSTHIGRPVVLMFELGDPRRPIVLGLLRQREGWGLAERTHLVEVDADGERLTISAETQLVLRCGEASITLTKSGKVLIKGAYISTRSTGLNRITGGSIQLN